MSELPPSSENTPRDREREFFDLLDTLPKELAMRWEQAYDDLPEVTEQFFDAFATFYAERQNAINGAIEVFGEVRPEIEEEIRLVEQVISETYGNPEYFLGSGRTAKVYTLPIAPSICIKYIFYDSPVDISVAEEVEILSELRSFVSATGIRTPVPYFKQVRSKDRHFYGMEKIPGENLFNIVQHPEANEALVRVAQSLNPQEALVKVLAFIDEIYVRFGITHGDLKQSNFMLTEQGELVVIDFGKGAIEQVGEDHEERVKNDKLTARHEISEFFKSVDKIKFK
jgi:predicted Ser/Thr protein kinase